MTVPESAPARAPKSVAAGAPESVAARRPGPAGGTDPLAEHRRMLFGVAYRILGSVADAEDVLQDAYLRWQGTDRAGVREPRRYLARTVTRLAIDRLRERTARGTYVGVWLPEPVPEGVRAAELDPLDTVVRRDSVATATLHLMERLDPVERAVFVLREVFELPYAEIGETVQRTPEHCRQLYRRATRRLADGTRRFAPGRDEHAQLLEKLLTAARAGDLPALRAVLHRDAVVWTDGGGKARAARNPVAGVDRVSRFLAGIYGQQCELSVELLELNGAPGAMVRSGTTHHAITFAVANGRISGLFLVANPDKLPQPAPRAARGA